MTMKREPLIIGLGGAASPHSSTEHAMRLALASVAQRGSRTLAFDGAFLASLPHYLTAESKTSKGGRALVNAIREADGLIIASPGYHGSISGIVKNAIDYLEETARDERVYFDGLAVGLIVTAHGWQATGSTMAALRSVVHAMRGWPTPLGAALNTSGGLFKDGLCTDESAASQLEMVGRQVYEFARTRIEAAAASEHQRHGHAA